MCCEMLAFDKRAPTISLVGILRSRECVSFLNALCCICGMYQCHSILPRYIGITEQMDGNVSALLPVIEYEQPPFAAIQLNLWGGEARFAAIATVLGELQGIEVVQDEINGEGLPCLIHLQHSMMDMGFSLGVD